MLAPIALFTYNRPHYLQRTLDALIQCPEAKETLLYVFCDAAKSDKDTAEVAKVRAIVASISGFQSVKLIFSSTNRGLANSLIAGITQVVNQHDCVIVLEDDLVVAPGFLRFLNDGIARYKDNPKVAGIHAHGRNTHLPLPDTFFLYEPGSWGWATWRSSWAHMRLDAKELLIEIKQRKLQRLFTFNYSYNFISLLERQIQGKVDSWAIRWYASNLLAGRLSLHPGKNLVQHIGVDTGTHFRGKKIPEMNGPLTHSLVEALDIPIELSQKGYAAHHDFFLSLRSPIDRLRVQLKSALLP